MDHQDWKPVVLSKTPNIEKQLKEGKITKDIVEKKDAGKNKQILVPDINQKKIEQTEIGILPTVPHTLALQIQQARTARNMTQTQLNTNCNFKKGTVSDYESGKALINSEELQKMSKILGIVLKKPKT